MYLCVAATMFHGTYGTYALNAALFPTVWLIELGNAGPCAGTKISIAKSCFTSILERRDL